MHYENGGSIGQMACTAVDYHHSDIHAKLDACYPPENSPLIKVLVDVAMSVDQSATWISCGSPRTACDARPSAHDQSRPTGLECSRRAGIRR